MRTAKFSEDKAFFMHTLVLLDFDIRRPITFIEAITGEQFTDVIPVSDWLDEYFEDKVISYEVLDFFLNLDEFDWFRDVSEVMEMLEGRL